jgi:hypothetical protein
MSDDEARLHPLRTMTPANGLPIDLAPRTMRPTPVATASAPLRASPRLGLAAVCVADPTAASGPRASPGAGCDPGNVEAQRRRRLRTR